MCRYALHPVKSHFVCIPCRFTAKHWSDDWECMRPKWRCPHCRQPMVDLGRDFKAPRRDNAAQWRKVSLLVDAGITFDSCGCSGPGYRPRTLADAKSELGRRRSDRKLSVGVKIRKRGLGG